MAQWTSSLENTYESTPLETVLRLRQIERLREKRDELKQEREKWSGSGKTQFTKQINALDEEIATLSNVNGAPMPIPPAKAFDVAFGYVKDHLVEYARLRRDVAKYMETPLYNFDRAARAALEIGRLAPIIAVYVEIGATQFKGADGYDPMRDDVSEEDALESFKSADDFEPVVWESVIKKAQANYRSSLESFSVPTWGGLLNNDVELVKIEGRAQFVRESKSLIQWLEYAVEAVEGWYSLDEEIRATLRK